MNSKLVISSPLESFKPWNFDSNLETGISLLCGNTANAKGNATNDVVKINPILVKISSVFDFPFNNLDCCNFTKIKGGITMIGVALMTLLAAVSPTAYKAAVFDVPTTSPSLLNTLIPFLISSLLIKKTFTTPAETTAANGTKRPKIILVLGLKDLSLGTMAFKPRATEHDAVTAME